MSKIKNEGQVFTPEIIVDMILNQVGYVDDNILTKKIMEPSFGKGAFLITIIDRIASRVKSPEKAKEIILQNVFGIEQDPEIYQEAIKEINVVLDFHNIKDIDLSSNLICGNTLECYKHFEGRFDYVVGNPPYVRIHNIQNRDILNNFQFASGNTDLYVLFYELGLKMLNSTGKLGFITPSSFLKNTSQKQFRNYLIENQYIETIVDFKSFQIFENVSTYTCICVLNKQTTSVINYIECINYCAMNMSIIETRMEHKNFQKLFWNKSWNLTTNQNLSFLETNQKQSQKIQDIVCVQNGIATLRDKIYIGLAWEDADETIPYMGKHTDKNKVVYFKKHQIESQILHRCVKASKFDGNISNQYILYPYIDAVPLTETELITQYPYAYQYLVENKEELLKRDMEKNREWFLFGRSQGLLNSNKPKLTFNHIIYREDTELNIWKLDEDIIVYSGIFITGDYLDFTKLVLNMPEFTKYCIITGKYMAGGYVSVNTKNVKLYGIDTENGLLGLLMKLEPNRDEFVSFYSKKE